VIRRGEAKGKAPVVPNFENLQNLITRECKREWREDKRAATLLHRSGLVGRAEFGGEG
jgi:hypothetical protein